MNLRRGRARRMPSKPQQIILAEMRRHSWQARDRWTARKIGFIAFWMFVAGSAYYVAFQALVAFGIGVLIAAFFGGLVFVGVVAFADRQEPR